MNSQRTGEAGHLKFQKPDRAPISHAVLPAAQLKVRRAAGRDPDRVPRGFRLGLHGRPAAGASSRRCTSRGATGMTSARVWHVRVGRHLRHPGGVSRSPTWPLRRVPLAGGFHRGAAVGPAVQRAHVRLRRPLVRPRGVDHLLRAAPAVARHGDLHDGPGRAEPRELERLMDDMLAFNLRWIDKWTTLEYDGLHFADDWGEQARLMIRPAIWRRAFQAALRRDVQAGRTRPAWTSGSTPTATSTTSSAT